MASSSSSSSSSSPSPALEPSGKPEISLDDMAYGDNPIEFLLQTLSEATSDSASSQDLNSPEWSHMSSWDNSDNKFMIDPNFDFSLPMDLDFQASMAVDPSALHFDNSMFAQQPSADSQPDGMYAPAVGQLLYPYNAPSNSWAETTTQRRLSITSASSSSGASLSPIPEHSPAISSSASDSGYSEGDSASELAHRVRQLAGVTLAVPVSAHVQQLAAAGTYPGIGRFLI